MPHQCTNCGYVFADGSKEMLSGCPECNGATFQFHPDDTGIPENPSDESPPDSKGGRVGRATSTVREWVSRGSSTTADGTDSTIDGSDEISDDETLSDDPGTSDTTEAMDETDMVSDEGDMNEADVLEDEVHASEDTAQASARSEFVSPDKIPSSSSSETQTTSSLTSPPSDGRVVREPTGDQPDLAELREELNDQFESIKIIEPGEYELNLMRLYNREEYIIALQENGRYIIQMPETWIGNDDE
jgi:predicted  nucleic acid-binding Zn-ribbon protein